MQAEQHAKIELLKKSIKNKGSLTLPSFGYSMYPFIKEHDVCTFVPCEIQTLNKGDVVLFYTDEGNLTAHRFLEKKQVLNKTQFLFKGDTNLLPDLPVFQDQIIGKLEQINRNGKISFVHDLSAKVWAYVIFTFPILSKILRKYVNILRKRKSNLNSGASL